MRLFKYVIIGLLFSPVPALAVQITVPSASGANYVLISNSAGTYNPYATSSLGFISTNTGDWAGTWQTYSPSHFTYTAFTPISINANNVISIATSSASQSGFLSATDWSLLHTATTTFSSPLSYSVSTNAVTCPTCNTTNATVSSVATTWPITGGTFTTTGTIGWNGISTSSVPTAYQLASWTSGSALTGTSTIGESLLANSGASAGSYTNANITVNAQGFVTSAANGTGSGITWPWTSYTNYGTTTQATSSVHQFWEGIFASSTSQISYASTTQVSATSLCIGATCKTAWPAGTVTSIIGGTGLAGGTISTTGTLSLISYLSTSSADTANYIPYWTTTNATPAKFGSVAQFQYFPNTGLQIGNVVNSGALFGTSTLLQMSTSTNNFTQAGIYNTNTGTDASADFVVGNSLSTNLAYFGDFGMNGSAYSNPTYSGEAANDVFVSSSDSNLDLEAASTTGNFGINFFTGGVATANKRGSINSTGLWTITNASTTNFTAGSSNPFNIFANGEAFAYDLLTGATGQVSPLRLISPTLSTSTAWTATSSVMSVYGDTASIIAPFAGTIRTFAASTSVGTLELEIQVNGTNLYYPASTTAGTYTFSTTFTKGQVIDIIAGNPASSPTKVITTIGVTQSQ